MCNYPERAPREGVFGDIHTLYDLTEVTPGLNGRLTVHPARAVFDYRDIRDAATAREAVACAVAFLSATFGVTFEPRAEVAPPPPLGDGAPRYLVEAILPGGLPAAVISRFTYVHVLDLGTTRQTREPVAA